MKIVIWLNNSITYIILNINLKIWMGNNSFYFLNIDNLIIITKLYYVLYELKPNGLLVIYFWYWKLVSACFNYLEKK